MLSFGSVASAQEPEGFDRGTLAVPLTHSDPGGAQLSLAYAQFQARRQSRGTIVFLAGGPGEPAVDAARDIVSGILGGLQRNHDIVVVDQRGAGRSSPLRCPTLRDLDSDDSVEDTGRAVAACAERLGDARRFFSTYETVLDLEALRRSIGAERIIPFGVSYGGQIAGEYARRFPDRVQAVVLDSPSPVEGVETLARLPQLALPRVLEEICFTRDCERILGDPRLLLARALEVMGERGIGGVTRGMLYDLIRASDTDLLLRAELPAALQAATQRDAAPLRRLVGFAGIGRGGSGGVNLGRLIATTCMEGQLPWAPDSDPSSRPGLLLEALRATEESYEPFSLGTVLTRVSATLCLSWPATPRPPLPPSIDPGPDVPVLVLAGREDLRTPLEDQRRIAGQFPRAQLVAVPGVGHSVLANDLYGCGQRAVARFLVGAALPTCPNRRLIDVALPAFRSLGAVPRPRGKVPARLGRTAVAVDLTLRDAERWAIGAALNDIIEVPGLRGGSMEVTGDGARLRRYAVVPGVRVSGVISDGPDRLRVTGRGATGRLVVRGATIRGVLDGTTIRYTRLAPRARGAVAAAIAAVK